MVHHKITWIQSFWSSLFVKLFSTANWSHYDVCDRGGTDYNMQRGRNRQWENTVSRRREEIKTKRKRIRQRGWEGRDKLTVLQDWNKEGNHDKRRCGEGSTNPGSVVFQVAAFVLNRVWVSQLSQKLDLLNDVLPLLPNTNSDTQMVTHYRYNHSNT